MKSFIELPQSVVDDLRANRSDSKVTEFPSGILGGEATNATKAQPITPQPPISAQSSSSAAPSSTTTATPTGGMKH